MQQRCPHRLQGADGEDGIALPIRSLCVLRLTRQSAPWSDHYVDIETQSELHEGYVVDRLDKAGDDRNQAVWADVVRTARKARSAGPSTRMLERRAVFGPAVSA